MLIIGVIDLLGGRSVHAVGGCRHGYRAVDTAAGALVRGDAAVLATTYVKQLGVQALYVADLDAIGGGAEQDAEVRAIAAAGADVWLDAGISTVTQAHRAMARGASRVVIGLETLTAFADLQTITKTLGRERVVFSLDLRDGRPIAVSESLQNLPPETLAARAADAGVTAVIVLDLARVGSGRGLDVAMLERVRRAIPGVTLLAGGGVRNVDDLQLLATIGCDGVLVATALHGAGGADLVRSASGLRDGHGNVTR